MSLPMPEWEFRQIRDHLRSCAGVRARAARSTFGGDDYEACRECETGVEKLATELERFRAAVNVPGDEP